MNDESETALAADSRARPRWAQRLRRLLLRCVADARRTLSDTVHSRLGRLLVLWILLSILAVELAILVPSVIRHREHLVTALVDRNRYAAQALVAALPSGDPATTIQRLPGVLSVRLKKPSRTSSGADLRQSPSSDGTVVSAGHPKLVGDRIWATWRVTGDDHAVQVLVSLDAANLRTRLYRYAGRVALLVLLITMFVSVVMMIPIGRYVLRPLTRIREALETARRTGRRALVDARATGEFETLIEEYNNSVHEEIAAEARGELLYHGAMHDPLTGLPNRSLFHERLDQAVARWRNHEERIALFLIDIDGFKLLNDVYGHVAGDSILRTFGERVIGTLRHSDTVGRLGGDEFAVLQPRRGNSEGHALLADRLREQTGEAIAVGTMSLPVTASIGVALLPEDGETTDDLLVKADLAMYQAKKSGGNRVCPYDDSLQDNAVHWVTLQADLAVALATGQFRLFYQPILDLHGDCVTAYEALLRWEHPELGTLTPDLFLHAAEQSAIMVPLGEWIMRTACRAWQRLRAMEPTCERIAVNVSPVQLDTIDADVLLRGAVEETGVPAGAVTLEITESTFMRSPDAAIRGLQRAARMGALIAIDDFGTGYSSLAELRDLCAHVLKIDKRFIDRVHTSERMRGLFEAIVAMGHRLDMRVVAEGIETHEQMRIVRAAGCDAVQGFLVGRPQALSGYDPPGQRPARASAITGIVHR